MVAVEQRERAGRVGTDSLQSRAYSERKRRLSFFVAAGRSTTGNQDIQEVKAGQGSTWPGVRNWRDTRGEREQRVSEVLGTGHGEGESVCV